MGYIPLPPKPQQQNTSPLQPPPVFPTSAVVAAPIPTHESQGFSIVGSIDAAKVDMKIKQKEYKRASKKSFFKRVRYFKQARCQKCGIKENGKEKTIVEGFCDLHHRERSKAKNEMIDAEKMYHDTKAHTKMDWNFAIPEMTDTMHTGQINLGSLDHEIEILTKLKAAIDEQLLWKYTAKQQEANR